jgi:hypothetical protein
VGGIPGEDRPQVAFTEYQHRGGGLVPGGEHETFRMGIRAGASGRDLHGFDVGGGEDRVEGCGGLPGAVADQEPEVRGAVAEVHQEVADLLGVHGPSGLAVTPRMGTERGRPQ